MYWLYQLGLSSSCETPSICIRASTNTRGARSAIRKYFYARFLRSIDKILCRKNTLYVFTYEEQWHNSPTRARRFISHLVLLAKKIRRRTCSAPVFRVLLYAIFCTFILLMVWFSFCIEPYSFMDVLWNYFSLCKYVSIRWNKTRSARFSRPIGRQIWHDWKDT